MRSLPLIRLFILLMSAHGLCDMPLQGSYLSSAKRGLCPPFPAWYALILHGFIHAGAVLLVTNNTACGIFELIVHTGTDGLKCRGLIGNKTDQAIHLACKLFYIAAIYGGWV